MKILGIDIGGTNIKYGFVNSNYEIEKTNRVKTKPSNIELQIENIIKKELKNNVFKYVAISSAGVIDTDNKIVLYSSDTIKNYSGTDFRNLENKFKIQVSVINDANAAALAEKNDKNNKFTNYATVTFGTGVGVGIVINNEIYQGTNYLGGELGYLKFGNQSLDKYLSYSDFNNFYKQKYKIEEDTDLSSKMDLLYKNKKPFKKALNLYLKNVADFLSNLAITLNLEHIYISGGISYIDKKFYNKIFDRFNKNLKYTPFKSTISISQFQNNAGILGATYFLNNLDKK